MPMTKSPDPAPGVFKSEVSHDPRYAVVFEDDGAVAYAYLLRDRKIVADVWLYSRGEASRKRPWTDPALKPPFANPLEFVAPDSFAPVVTPHEVSFAWSFADDADVVVEVSIRGCRHARIGLRSKPGWCRLATKDGPLALKLE
jgi:hypothetical protein